MLGRHMAPKTLHNSNSNNNFLVCCFFLYYVCFYLRVNKDEYNGTWHEMAIELTQEIGTRITTHTHTHPFNGPLSGTTRVSRYHYHRKHLGDNIPFPTRFHGSAKRKCGFFPQHHGNRVNCRCNHNFVCLA